MLCMDGSTVRNDERITTDKLSEKRIEWKNEE